jgi:hypothetical protein
MYHQNQDTQNGLMYHVRIDNQQVQMYQMRLDNQLLKMYNNERIYLKGFTLLFLYEVSNMKKIILLVSLLMINGLVYGEIIYGKYGHRYTIGVNGGVKYMFEVYGPVPPPTFGRMICVAQAPLPRGKDTAFQVINEGLFWYGNPPGEYSLNASNNYRVTLTFNHIFPLYPATPSDIIIINKSLYPVTFMLECNYTENK